MTEARSILLKRLRTDLIGPSGGEEEIIKDRPADRYLTGILFPQNLGISEGENEKIEETQSGKVANTDTTPTDTVAVSRTARPPTAGISFAAASDGISPPKIIVDISAGTYKREAYEKTSDSTSETNEKFNIELGGENKTSQTDSTDKSAKQEYQWRRSAFRCTREITLDQPIQEIDLGQEDSTGKGILPGLGLFIKSLEIDGQIAVTVQAINKNQHTEQDPRHEVEEQTFFQFEMSVVPFAKTRLVPRLVTSPSNDDDSKTAALIYRNTAEYATGHTCAANWILEEPNKAIKVATAWIPETLVKSVDPNGDPIFKLTYEERGLNPPTAKNLAEANPSALKEMLQALTDAYEYWIQGETAKLGELPSAALKKQAEDHLARCEEALRRMREGASLISSDDLVRRAFQTANAAMEMQASWSRRKMVGGNSESTTTELTWRPFQLGFALMCLKSFQDPTHEDRQTLDLIWFPTGGGKTEAYLLVVAFLLFYRRLANQAKALSYGTAVLMRYTLRTLTIQQFQRAAALICACESLRLDSSHNTDGGLGNVTFSIGLWVGEGSTPNKSKTAIESLHADSQSTPKQIEICPACKTELVWKVSGDKSRVLCRCENNECVLSEWDELPILTVDDRIYLAPPSMLIGTVDKFAQIVRRDETSALFGCENGSNPPDLIIQDELHLISGPLGTLAGIYETAIDRLCAKGQVRPKVIGSTATIRRAEEQVKALFQRKAFQFPPPAIDCENSGFAKIDNKSPGRLYVGLTTAGRTDKYVLQAVCASLLQSVLDSDIPDPERDPYGTLVAYFNSLRILGGALVAMQDDVPKSIRAFSQRRNEEPRCLSEPEEMTSRKASSEIPQILRRLENSFGEHDFIDILLASNMLSVGVDIPRLGLMVVNGQPKQCPNTFSRLVGLAGSGSQASL